MIKFYCGECENKIGVPDDFAGKLVRCPKCSQPTRVPELDFEPERDPLLEPELDSKLEPDTPADNGLADEIFPGVSNQSFQMADQSEQIPAPEHTPPPKKSLAPTGAGVSLAAGLGRLPLAVGASFIGALVGGAIWAGIVYVTDYELGIVAWVIGILVGFSATLFTEERSVRLGLIAAAMAVIGILIGKVLIVKWAMAPELAKIFQSAEITPEDIQLALNDPEEMFYVACITLVINGEFTQEYADQVSESYGENDPTLPTEQIAKGRVQVQSLLKGWTRAEKQAAVRDAYTWMTENAAALAEEIVSQIGLIESIKATLSFWDILWFLLAVSSAFKLGMGISSGD